MIDQNSWSEAAITPRRSKIGGTTMPDESRPTDKHQPLELTPDFLYESRYEFVTMDIRGSETRSDLTPSTAFSRR
jgi:hypothetical protein